MDIRKRIDELRKQEGWTRTDLARKLGISYAALSNWYNEKNYMPSLKTIDEICVQFGITPSRLFYDAETDNADIDQMTLNEIYRGLPDDRKKILVRLAEALRED